MPLRLVISAATRDPEQPGGEHAASAAVLAAVPAAAPVPAAAAVAVPAAVPVAVAVPAAASAAVPVAVAVPAAASAAAAVAVPAAAPASCGRDARTTIRATTPSLVLTPGPL